MKNLKEKIGVVSGMVVTNGLNILEQNKVICGMTVGLNVLGEQDVVKGVTKSAKQIGVVGVLGGVLTTVLQTKDIKEMFKELDSEDEVIIVEGEEE